MNIFSMQRSFELEILDEQDLPDEQMVAIHRDLDRIHAFLGVPQALISLLRRDPLPVRKVLDVGCGHGGMLRKIQKSMGVEVVGVDLRPPANQAGLGFSILQANVVHDQLPTADVAISVCFAHHLSEDEVIGMIRNVGRSCRRFVILDLVRSPVPLALFRTFVWPFVTEVNGKDGYQSIRRSFTAAEFQRIAERALDGRGEVRVRVAPFEVRQIVDIRY